MKEKISGVEVTIEEIDTLVKEDVRAKNSGHKTPENMEYYQKT